MKTYNVTIRATITRTITVEAEDTDKASELAHQLFDWSDLECEHDYDEETIDMEEMK